MAIHYFSEQERTEHLQQLLNGLNLLIPALEESGRYEDSLKSYKAAREKTSQLLSQGFTQEELSALSRAIPKLFWLHKEWMPPLEKVSSTGASSEEPLWYKKLEPLEAVVTEAAEKLRMVGEY